MSYDELKEEAKALGIKVDGRWSEARIEQEINRYTSMGDKPTKSLDEVSAAMNDLANRIYEGQGSIPDIERIRRITKALKDKGYTDFSKLDVPVPNLKDHLKRLNG